MTKYFEILSNKDLENALTIAKEHISMVAVEEDIDSGYYTNDYDDFEELEREVWRWWNRVTSSHQYDDDDELITVLVFFNGDLLFETGYVNYKNRLNFEDFKRLVK